MENKSIKSKNIYQRLHSIMAEVGSLDKDKRNTMQNYEYLSEANVKHAIQPLLVKHGVVFTLEVEDLGELKEIGRSAKGNQIWLTRAKMNYRFTNIDNPDDRAAGVFSGTGADMGDKGVYKAITGAIKYILTSTFLVPTGDDPEEEKEEHRFATVENKVKLFQENKPISLRQRTAIVAIANQIGDKEMLNFGTTKDWTMAQASDYISSKGTGGYRKEVEEQEEIPAEDIKI